MSRNERNLPQGDSGAATATPSESIGTRDTRVLRAAVFFPSGASGRGKAVTTPPSESLGVPQISLSAVWGRPGRGSAGYPHWASERAWNYFVINLSVYSCDSGEILVTNASFWGLLLRWLLGSTLRLNKGAPDFGDSRSNFRL